MSQNQRRGRGGKGNQSREVTISKALSLLLRHAAEKEGLKMDSQGYANVADVVCRTDGTVQEVILLIYISRS
jgi:2'-phosphotransferase